MKIVLTRCRYRGLTLIEVVIIIAVLCILVVVLLPRRHSYPGSAKKIACANNLKQAGVAFKVWAEDHGGGYPIQVSVTNGGTKEFLTTGVVSPHFQVMSNELNTPKILVCPTDKGKTPAESFAVGFANANISYFVGLDAGPDMPQMLLAGDDNIFLEVILNPGQADVSIKRTSVPSGLISNLPKNTASWLDTRHNKQGNILLADGSVQGVSSSGLRTALANSGVATNRLAMP